MVLLALLMEKAIWTSYFRELTPEDAVRLLAREGWSHLELSCEHAAAVLAGGDSTAAAEQFLRLCHDLGVSLPQAHFRLDANIALPPGPQRRQEMEELKRWLDLFSALGVEAAVLHPGGRSTLEATPLSGETLDANVEGLCELLEHCPSSKTVVCLENGPGAGELARLIKRAGHERLGICFDTGHLAFIRARWPGSAQTEADFVRQAGRYLKALHLNDNDGSGDQHMLPFPGGKVDWDGLVQALAETAYDGLLNFEVPGEINCPLAERVAKLRRAAQIAQRWREAAQRT